MKTLSLLLLFSSASVSIVFSQNETASSTDLKAYTHCEFSDGLQLVDVAPLAPGVTARTVDTVHGVKQINMLFGLRIMFAYPNTHFFANVKAEKLPASEYPQLKAALIENFDYVLGSAPSNKRNVSVGSMVKGVEARGLDRDKLEGGVIGFYLLFANDKHIATTIYLLNQEAAQRKFQTLDEYKDLRDHFLRSYTSCIEDGSK